MGIRRIITCLLCLLLLTGVCAAAELAPSPESHSGDTLSVRKEPVLFTGCGVTVDGTEIADCVRYKRVDCVELGAFCEALDTTWIWVGNKGGLLWDGKWIDLYGRVGGFFFGEEWCRLPVGPVVSASGVYVPLEALCRALGIGYLYDARHVRAYVTPAAGDWEIPAGYRVPTLMYHGVAEATWGAAELFVRPTDMEAQLQYLTENGYTPIFFEDLARIDQIEKPVLLTFDDGYVDNYTELFPLLQKYQVKATIFVIAGTVDYNKNNLTSAQIKEMSDSGLVSIQSHTQTHPYLSRLTREQQAWEMTCSKLTLTRITGKEPYVLAYPVGDANQDTLELAALHFNQAVIMNGGDYQTGTDCWQIPRWYVSRYSTLGAFADMVS